MTFENQVIENTINKLVQGEDYREEVINAINVEFLDFTVHFFKEIVNAKINSEDISLEWYKKNFINNDTLNPADSAIYAGMNKKTITNIYGTANKEVVLDVANSNFEYLVTMLEELENDINSNIGISIKLTYNNIYAELNLTESLLVINALATKKMAIRGGAWSSIGKKVEKPLVTKLCRMCKVPFVNIDASVFKKNEELDFDREVDYRLINEEGEPVRVEVKLMGRGNPESADVIFARDTRLFIADTLSEQNKNQFRANNVEFLELKGNKNIVEEFREILKRLNIPMSE